MSLPIMFLWASDEYKELSTRHRLEVQSKSTERLNMHNAPRAPTHLPSHHYFFLLFAGVIGSSNVAKIASCDEGFLAAEYLGSFAIASIFANGSDPSKGFLLSTPAAFFSTLRFFDFSVGVD
jgi:hypothetical protein